MLVRARGLAVDSMKIGDVKDDGRIQARSIGRSEVCREMPPPRRIGAGATKPFRALVAPAVFDADGSCRRIAAPVIQEAFPT